MKTFVYKLLAYIAVLIATLFILDYVYTASYYNPVNPRSKTSWVMSFKSKDTLDYALFGSSRCLNSINPTIINKKLGTNGLNLAYAACNPFEIKLSIKTLLKKQPVKRIFIQMDYSFNNTEPDPIAKVEWMPFLKEDYVFEAFKVYDKDYRYLRHIPFYRYMKYDGKIGIRDFILSYTKESIKNKNYGYDPLNGSLKKAEVSKSKLKAIENPHLKEIIAFCETSDIQLEFFTAPIYAFEGKNTVLEKMLPNYSDFTNVFKDPNKFQDKLHINDEGATEFTTLFMDYYFLNSKL